jgi:hypothetical protein
MIRHFQELRLQGGEIAASFDRLVGAGEQRGRHFEAERSGSRDVDNEIKLGGLDNW